jgi:hypothetical protein
MANNRSKRLYDLVDMLHRASSLASDLETEYEELREFNSCSYRWDHIEPILEHLQNVYYLTETAGELDELEQSIKQI